MSRSAIIVGGGLGGLVTGVLLSRAGWKVTVLEQGIQAGGALQSFEREGIRFDTGFHSVGGLGPGEPLEQLFRPLGLMDLPWYQVDPDECNGCRYPFLRLSSGTPDEIAHVVDPFRQSVWRLKGGGKTLVDALVAQIKGEVLTRKKVLSIANHMVICADSSTYQADIVVSSIHPRTTLELVQDHIHNAYHKRLERLVDGPGVFTVNVKLRPGAMRYINHSIFLSGKLMIHFGEPDENGYARSLDLMEFCEQGEGGRPASMTGPERASRAQHLIAMATTRLPELFAAVQKYWTSTPATWERFTGTPGGSAYGIIKRSELDYLPARTPLPWLFLTGQNIGLHGVLGTTVSAYNTFNEINQ